MVEEESARTAFCARNSKALPPLTLRFRLEPNLRDREPGVLDGTRFFGVVIERDGVSSDDFGDPGDDPAVFPRLDKNHYLYKKIKV